MVAIVTEDQVLILIVRIIQDRKSCPLDTETINNPAGWKYIDHNLVSLLDKAKGLGLIRDAQFLLKIIDEGVRDSLG